MNINARLITANLQNSLWSFCKNYLTQEIGKLKQFSTLHVLNKQISPLNTHISLHWSYRPKVIYSPSLAKSVIRKVKEQHFFA